MNFDSKKAAPDGRNIQDGERENALPGSKTSPVFDSITPGVSGQAPIWSRLSTGAENAIRLEVLAEILGTTPRDVRKLVHRERAAGYPIISSTSFPGFFKPACREDVDRFARSMKSRASETYKVAAAAQRFLDELCGQERMEDVFDG